MADFASRLVQVRSDRARQLCYAGQGPAELRNRDLLLPVYLGSDEGFNPGGQDIAIIDPLGSQAVDGEADIWGMTQSGGTAIVNVITGGTGSQASPAQIAAQIAAAGVFLTANDVVLLQSLAVPLPAATTVTLSGNLAAGSFQSYDITMILTPGGGSTFPFARVTLLMQDPKAGAVWEEDWIVPMLAPYTAGATGTFGYPSGGGQMRGSTIAVIIRNLDSVAATLTSLTLSGISRTSIESQWQDNPQNRAYAGSPYILPPIGQGFDKVLGAQNSGTLGIGATVKYLLGLYAGPVSFQASASGGVAGKISYTLGAVAQAGGGLVTMLTGTSGAGGLIGPTIVQFPRSPVILTVVSTDATADTLIWSAVAQANI